jgi:hypothetical protein
VKKITELKTKFIEPTPSADGLDPWQRPDFDHVAAAKVMIRVEKRLAKIVAFLDKKYGPVK